MDLKCLIITEGHGRWSEPKCGHLGSLPTLVANATVAQYWQNQTWLLTTSAWNSSKPHLSVHLERTLSFKQHLEEVKTKVSCPSVNTQQISTQALGQQRQQLFQADSRPAIPSIRQHKRCSVLSLRTCLSMHGWREAEVGDGQAHTNPSLHELVH